METPMETEANNMVSRNVLSEIPLVEGRLSTDSQYGINRIDHYTNIMNSTFTYFSPSFPNPDELVIRQRGRRSAPVTFSPDIDDIKQSSQESLIELDCLDINKNSIIPKQSSPCKRLFVDPIDLSDLEKDEAGSPDSKKKRTEPKFEYLTDNCLLSALKSLTSNQLIGIIEQIITHNPNIEKIIRRNFPVADLKPLEDHIHYLKRNIYQALPNNRLISKTDPTAYNRVSIHIMDFKNYVLDQAKRLFDSNQWPVVVDYVFMAWKHVRHTPIWDNPPHNSARKQCFQTLMSFCIISLRHMKDTLDEQKCESYKNKIKALFDDYDEDMEECLKLLDCEFK